MGLEFPTDVLVLAVPTVDVAVFGEDGGAKLQDAGVEEGETVMEMADGGVGEGDGRGGGFMGERESRRGHGDGHARRPRETSFEGGGHGDSWEGMGSEVA